ncbi:hypothetical protein LJR175_003137 [Variovorax sp. LjRoot175]|uniref:hypothetical protein n=1 Tax=Variovorax sp. LjRoot175 TaxID=3342276 RepID=UPI003ECE1373
MKKTLLAAVLGVIALAGCGTTGVQPIGNGIYMSSKLGSMLTYNGGEVKADLFREAAEFCGKQGKKVDPVSSSSQGAGIGTYASAEIQFRCV